MYSPFCTSFLHICDKLFFNRRIPLSCVVNNFVCGGIIKQMQPFFHVFFCFSE